MRLQDPTTPSANHKSSQEVMGAAGGAASSAKGDVFARTLGLQTQADDHYRAQLGDEWWVFRGPNGGFLAGLMMEAMTQRLGDPSRVPRVLTVHYPKVPREGAIDIQTRVLRQGRSMTWVNAELSQGGEQCVVARAAFSGPWPSVNYNDVQPPQVPPITDALHIPPEVMPRSARNFKFYSTFGAPYAAMGAGTVGGYIRPAEPRIYDPQLLAIISDAWYPAAFARTAEPVMAATLDLTVHFRDYAALTELDPNAYVLAVFRSQLATEGFFEEDGELWAPDGRLLAQSRQLAIAAPLSR